MESSVAGGVTVVVVPVFPAGLVDVEELPQATRLTTSVAPKTRPAARIA
jgi:hypothetical protein